MDDRAPAPSTQLRAVALFDLDDTLIDRTGNFRRWANRFLSELGFAAEGPDLEWLLTVDRQGATEREVLFEAVRDRFDLRSTVEDLVTSYNRDIARLARCSDSTVNALAMLRAAGWRIGVVTNGFTTQQRAKITSAELDRLVDCCVVSESVGAAKPDQRPFTAALDELGGNLRDAWMIGDDPVNDIAGAREVRISTIWIHNGREWPHDHFSPDHIAADVAAAVRILLSSPTRGAGQPTRRSGE